MSLPAARTPFIRLALWTTAVTYALILVGGLVRASGAGLGCPDWPRCFGTWVPPLSAEALPPEFDASLFNPVLMWTEYLNRVLGVLVGLFILATAISAWRHHRRDPHILWPAVVAALLTGFQGWLGGRVVAHELAPWIVTTHLIVAIVIVQLLVYATVHAVYRRPRLAGPAGGGMGTGRAGAGRTPIVMTIGALIVVTLIQVGLGTQVRGGVDQALDAGIARTAALATVGPLDGLHRSLALLVLALAVITMLLAWSRHPESPRIVRWTSAVVGLSAAQVVLGVVLAYLALPQPAQVLHLLAASLLMGAQMVQLLVTWWE